MQLSRPLAPEVQKRLRSAQEVLEISGSASSATDDEQLRWSRSALRNAREAKAFINLSGRTSSAGSENNDDSDLHIRQKQDAEFSTSVRLRMTKKRVQQAEKRIRETLKDLDENTSVNIETRVEGTRQLLDIANTQLENGNLDEALETSDSALDHADSVTEDIEKLVPGL
jgi:exonuclease VII large subunit